MSNKKSVLVTGAAGFIGSHLVDSLLKFGYFVIGVDNFFRGSINNLNSALKNKNFKLLELDLTKYDATHILKNLYIENNISTIFHLAAINGTEYFYDASLTVLDANNEINKNVAFSINDTGVDYIVYSSTSEVYGEPYMVPTSETHPILLNSESDRDSYASSKALGEFYVRFNARKKNIKYLNLRIFNQYGPRMVSTKYGQVVAEFISRALQKKEFTIIGDGSNTRSFCYVEDCAHLILILFQLEVSGVLNIGGGEEITINDLAKLIHKKIGKEFNPIYLPERIGDHKRRAPNINKLRSIIGNDFEFVSLDNGLDKTISYYKNLKE